MKIPVETEFSKRDHENPTVLSVHHNIKINKSHKNSVSAQLNTIPHLSFIII